jgi:hypothetical protein
VSIHSTQSRKFETYKPVHKIFHNDVKAQEFLKKPGFTGIKAFTATFFTILIEKAA